MLRALGTARSSAKCTGQPPQRVVQIALGQFQGEARCVRANAEWWPAHVTKISRARRRTKNRPSRICHLVAVIATDSQFQACRSDRRFLFAASACRAVGINLRMGFLNRFECGTLTYVQ